MELLYSSCFFQYSKYHCYLRIVSLLFNNLSLNILVFSLLTVLGNWANRYFVADELKEGGAYETKTGQIKKIDLYHHSLVFTDGTQIDIENLMDLETHFRF